MLIHLVQCLLEVTPGLFDIPLDSKYNGHVKIIYILTANGFKKITVSF